MSDIQRRNEKVGVEELVNILWNIGLEDVVEMIDNNDGARRTDVGDRN